MEINRDSLRKLYSEMETQTLLEKSCGDLTDLAKEVINEELKSRNVSVEDQAKTETKFAYETKRAEQEKSFLTARGVRFLSSLFDAIIGVIIALIVIVIPFMTGLFKGGGLFGIFVFTYAIYFLFSDALFKGQSIAKYFVGIYVIDKNTHKKCSFGQSFVRNIFLMVLGVIDFIFIFGEKKQRLGDRIAGTIVVNRLNIDSDNQTTG